MPTSYTSLIGLALPVTGELSGTWGDVVNNYITNYLDSAVAGTQTISGSQTAVTLSVTNGSSLVTAGSGATGSAQFQIINCTGNPAGLLTITAPASSRQYIIINATSTSQSVKIVGTGPTTGVTLIAGEKAHVAWNGSDFVKIATTAAAGGSNTQVQYNSSGVLAGSSNLTFDGTNLTVGGTASATKLIPTGGAITGNGMYLPAANSVSITTNGANAIYIDANQNVGFGTTLAAWGSGAGMKAIQMGGTSFSFLAGSVAQYIYGNAYYDGTNNRYINNGTACSYGVNASGQFQWFQAASGTAGTAITFTQAMTLDTSGRLLLGTTTTTNNIRLDEKFAIVGVNVPYNGMALTGYTGAGSGSYRPLIDFNRSRGTTDGSMTVIANNDILGSIIFRGSDGTSFQDAAMISGEVDGTPGANDMPGRLTFATTPDGSTTLTERARITSGGYFKASNTGSYIGSTSSFHETVSNATSDGVLVVESTSTSYTSYILSPVSNRNTTNNTYYAIGYFHRGAGAYKFLVADSGNVTNTNGSYGTISDVKMKTDIVDAGSQWADIKAIRFRKFKMKDDPEQIVQLGVVAQEVEQTSPGLVEEHQDRNEKGESLGTTTKSVKTSVLLMKAAVALQEALTRIEQLEAKVAALESKGA